jgi:gliding motility-associated-like protein
MQARAQQFSVSRDGTALIGLINNTDYLSVYKYSGGTWNTITTATSLKNESGGNAGFLKGMDISDGGNRVVFLDNSTNPRSIHIYEYGGGTTWTKMASFQENAPDVRDKGNSIHSGGNVNISRDGNRVMVAAPGSQKPGDQYVDRGAFLIYEWDGTAWSKTDLVYGKVMSQYEGSVAKMSGDGSTFVTGAMNTTQIAGYKKGVVRVYRKTDDNDGDGYTNEYEALCGSDPNDASSRPADNDGDGSPDCFDTDDDNDGVTDTEDCDPLDPLETLDTDSDGICNNDDTDDDNDGTLDTEDDLPLDPTETVDTDSDGTGDNADADDDGDGFLDIYETECLSDPLDSLSFPDDIDGDFIPDCQDNDNDNDGVTDDIETQCGTDPLDSSSTPLDTDLDGTLDCFDLDDDNDSYNDNDDDFPLDATEWLDTDGDGVGNNADEDDDNDGYWDYEDFFQFDPFEWFDFDKDGIGDNADTDDDNDGYPDSFDAFPFNPFEWVDTDGDGVGNNDDTDNDDDGIPDSEEENIDTDGDGLNNDVDTDDDGDGIPTLAEDANGNGDPTDDDEDGDGIYDAIESSLRDFDSDGVVDQLDNDNTDPYNDSDGDGYSNQDETKAGTDPLDNTEYPEDFESEELNFKITNFFSPNGDGVDDQWRIKEVDRYPKSQIWIFLRTGKEIFYASPYQNNWDGNFKGNSLPSGSYYYRLDLDGNGKIDFEGWVYLQR